MKLSCDIIRDLLPLYAEGLASEDSQTAVREHLQECEGCRKCYEQMNQSPVLPREAPDLGAVRRGLWKRRLLTALCAVLVVCMLGCWFLSWLTAPIYLDERVITDVQNNHDGTVTIYMDAAAAGRKTFQFEIDATEIGETFVIWTSRWLEYTWSEPIPRPFAITRTVMHNGIYLFTGREGESDLLIYENPQKYISGGVETLPRLVLGGYFLMALGIGAALNLLALFLWKKRTGKWILAFGTLGWCYALCQGLVCGFSFPSFFASQEFSWAAVMGLCLWGVLLCMWGLRRKK